MTLQNTASSVDKQWSSLHESKIGTFLRKENPNLPSKKKWNQEMNPIEIQPDNT